VRQVAIPVPAKGEVRIRVHACGVCHSDVVSKYNGYGIPNFFPHTPGHEAVGVVDAVGEGVTAFKAGERVGVGWFGGACHACETCLKGNAWLGCSSQPPKITSVTSQGGYADYVVAREDALARVPSALTDEDAAPLLCAGITTFNALRNTKARAGDVVVVIGVGGLGHLGVQFAAKMGFHTVAVSRGTDKKELALQLGARSYIDSAAQNAVKEIKALGGARVILDTAGQPQVISEMVGALAYDGQLVVSSVVREPVTVDFMTLLSRRGTITAWGSGDSRDIQDTLDFSALVGVRSMNEIFPLDQAEAAFQRMLTTKAKFRVVLKMV